MYKTLVIIAVLGLCTSVFATWERLGPYGGYIRSIEVSPSDGDLVHLTNYTYPAKIARSTDGGASWTTIGEVTNYPYCYTIDPTDINKQYIGSSSRTYRSTNGGVDWSSTYISNTYFNDMIVHPTTTNIVYSAGMKYVTSVWQMAFHKSTDYGVTWTSTILHTGEYSTSYNLAIDPNDPNTIYVCGYERTASVSYCLLYKSTDGGSSWQDIDDTFPTGRYLNSVYVHPTNSNIVYAGASSGIFRSTDAGASWSQVATYSYNYVITSNPNDPNVVYSGGYYDIYKSTNAGVSWTLADAGLIGKYFRGIAIHPTNTAIIYTGGDAGFYKTTNAGSSWFAYNNDLNLANIGNFAVAPSSPTTIYTSQDEVGIFRSSDCGSNWTILPTPVACGNICAIGIHNDDPNTLCALEGSG